MGYAHFRRPPPLEGLNQRRLTSFGFRLEGAATPRGDRLEQNKAIMNPVKALENHGQAVWLDFLARGFVAKGDLKKLIDTDGVKGVTSNPVDLREGDRQFGRI